MKSLHENNIVLNSLFKIPISRKNTIAIEAIDVLGKNQMASVHGVVFVILYRRKWRMGYAQTAARWVADALKILKFQPRQ